MVDPSYVNQASKALRLFFKCPLEMGLFHTGMSCDCKIPDCEDVTPKKEVMLTYVHLFTFTYFVATRKFKMVWMAHLFGACHTSIGNRLCCGLWSVPRARSLARTSQRCQDSLGG